MKKELLCLEVELDNGCSIGYGFSLLSNGKVKIQDMPIDTYKSLLKIAYIDYNKYKFYEVEINDDFFSETKREEIDIQKVREKINTQR